MDRAELCYTPATELVARIRKKDLSPVEVVDAALERIEQLNPKLNAYVTVTAEQAREAAKGAEAAVMRGDELGILHGVPVSIKDLVFTKGVRTSMGSMMFEHFTPEEDAVVVERLRDAGAIMLGKTNTPEFGHKGATTNLVFGTTVNPWRLDRTCGGSSGGAGVAVATGMGPLAVGTDGGGSIRIPSSFCGIYGLKPQYGRVAKGAGMRGWTAVSHTGPMTRTVRDAALMLDAIAGPDERDPASLPASGISYLAETKADIRGLRVAWSPNLGYAPVDPEVRKVTEGAARTFAELGCNVEQENPGFDDPEEGFITMVAADTYAAWGDKLDEWGDRMDPTFLTFLKAGADITAKAYVHAAHRRADMWNNVQQFFSKYDLLLTPTVTVPPFALDIAGPQEIGGQPVEPWRWVAFTFPWNLTGQPAATVPCGWTADGLPVGLQIVGRRYDEVTVLRASAAFEQAAPWADKRPQVA